MFSQLLFHGLTKMTALSAVYILKSKFLDCSFFFTYFAERLSLRECVAPVTKATSHWMTYLSKTINVHLLVRHIVLLTIGATGLCKKDVVMFKFVN